MPKRINKNSLKQQPKTISFSFKYLQTDHSKFQIAQQNKKYWLKLIKRLKDLSEFTRVQLIQNESLRCHKIDWKDTSEKNFGLLNEKQLVHIPYQFSISSKSRVHGFFIEDVFYIVWLDPEHKLYP